MLGFHADNGSEDTSRRVANLLEKLQATEFAKSPTCAAHTDRRARQTTDKRLVESKNASVVCKYLGHGHTPAAYAESVNDFAQNVLSSYLNCHRLCLFARKHIDAKRKVRKIYPEAGTDTLYEKIKPIPNASAILRAGVNLELLDAIAYALSDNKATYQLNAECAKLFKTINQTRASVA